MKKKHLRSPFLVCCLLPLFSLPLSVSAQTSIYSPNFSVNGATSGNNWQVLSSNNCDSPGTFAASGGTFVINDMEGSGCGPGVDGANDNTLQIGPINVSSATCLRVLYTIEGAGIFESPGTLGGDNLDIEIALDGATVAFDTYNGTGPLANGGPKTVNIPIQGNSLMITITGGNQSVDEFYFISDIDVLDTGFTPNIPDIDACVDQSINLSPFHTGIPGLWSGDGVVGTRWATFGLNPGTYPLTFEPFDPCGSPVTVTGTVSGGSIAGSASLNGCGTGTTAIFNLTLADDDIQNGANGEVFWFRDILKINQINNPENYLGTDGETVYGAYREGNCLSQTGELLLNIEAPPTLTAPADVEACGSYTLPALPAGLSYDAFNEGDVILNDEIIEIFSGSGTCVSRTSYEVTINSGPMIDAYAGAIKACDSLLLPPITGTNLSGNQAYYTEPDGEGERFLANDFLDIKGANTFYMYDINAGCSTEVAFDLNINNSGVINARDTIVCDTFAFLPYQGTGNFLGYFSQKGGLGTQYQPGDGLKQDPGTVKVYVRAGEASCVSEDSFNITFRLAPDITSLSAFDVCDTISLPEIAGEKLSGNEAYYTLSNGQGQRFLPGTLINTSTSLFIYDRIGSCSEELIFTVLVIPQPKIASIGDQIACDTFALPPITGEDLTGAEIYSSGLDGTGIQFSPGDVLATAQKIYVYDERGRCSSQDSFNLAVNYRPQLAGPIGDRLVCDTFSLPPLTGNDLIGNEVITMAPFGLGDTLQTGTLFTDSTVLYLFGGVDGCRAEDSLRLFINPQPVLDTLPDTLVCDFYILPMITGEKLTATAAYYDAPGGTGNRFQAGDTLSTTGTYYTYDSTEIGCTAADTFLVQIGLTPQLDQIADTLACTSFSLSTISGNQLNAPIYTDAPFGGGTVFNPGQIFTDSLKIYLYDEDLGCFDSTSFVVRVLPQVELDLPFLDTMVCDSLILGPFTGNMLTGNGGYFSEPLGAGMRFDSGFVIRDSTILFAFDGRETCIDTATIQVAVQATPLLNPLPDIETCDFYILPMILGQNLTEQAAYFDLSSGDRFQTGDTLRMSRMLEVRDTNDFGCGSIQPIDIRITPTPQLTNIADVFACDSFILAPIQGQFLAANTGYYTQANGAGQPIFPGTVFTNSQNLFVYSDSLGCSTALEFRIDLDYTPQVNNALVDSTDCFNLEIPELAGNNLSANTAYYTEANGLGMPLSLPFSLTQDTILYLFGNNGICTLSDTINLQVKQVEGDLFIRDSIDCNGELGSIDLLDLVAEAPFSIEWNDPGFSGLTSLNNIPAGDYNVLIRDVNGCELNRSISLVQADSLLLNCAVNQQVSVPNGSDGQIQLDFVGGTLPYTLIFSGDLVDTLRLNNAGSLSIDTLAAGSYNFTLIDAKGCTQNCSLEITAPPCILSADLESTNITCNSFQDGTLNLNITNAQAPLSIDWSDDSLDGSTSALNVAAGTYTVTVTDANTCRDSSTTMIIEPAPLRISVAEEQPVSDGTAGDGIVAIQFSGGTGPYTLIWDGPETDSILLADTSALLVDSLIQGVYIFGIIDSSGCKISATVTITNPNCGMTVQFEKLDQTCPNTTDGRFVALVNGGVGPYEFIWSDGNRDSIRNDLAAGIYDLQVLDSETCVTQATDTIRIANPLPSLSLLSNTIQCEEECQSIEVGLSGTAPFNFSWQQRGFIQQMPADSVQGTVIGARNNTEELFYCIPADSLTFRVLSLEDAFCRVRLDTVFEFNILLNPILLVNDTLCENDSLRINNQLFTKANPSDTMLLADQAGNGCDSLVYVDLTFIDMVYDTLRQTLCQEDTLLINGTVYGLSNPLGTETFVGQGNFGCDSILFIDLDFIPTDTSQFAQTLCREAFMEIGDTRFDQFNPNGLARIDNAAASGCDSLVNVSLTFVDQFTTDLNPTICAEDSLLVNETVYDFLNPNGSETLTAFSGCDSIIQIDLLFFPVDTQFVNPVLCPGDSILVNGITYNESNPFALQTIPSTDTNGCNSIIKIDLSYLENARANFEPIICLTDTVFVNGNAYHADKATGLEVFVDAAQNGCDSLVNVAVQFFPEIRTIYQDTLCHLDSLVVNGTVYNVDNPSGEERLIGQGQNACDSIVVIDLSFEPAIIASLAGTTAICVGNSTDLVLELSGDQNYDITYRVNNQSPISVANVSDGFSIPVQPIQTSAYELASVTGLSSGCAGSITGEAIVVTVSELDIRINQTSNYGGFGVSCAEASDGQLSVSVNGGVEPYNFNWNTGSFSATLDDVESGTYFVSVMDEVGCIGGDTVQLIAPPLLEASFSTAASICPSNPNGVISLNSISGGTGNYEFSLDGQFFTPLGQIPSINNGLSPGNYEVLIQDGNDCQQAYPLTIAEETIFLDLGPDLELKIGDSIQLQPFANFPLLDFTWTPTTDLSNTRSAQPFVSPEVTTAYTLTAIDSSGCSIVDAVLIYVDKTREVYAPTVFTPDEDGINDRFTIFGGPNLVEIELLQVYDRWGNLLYEGNALPPSNDQFGWNGKYRNELAPGGAYIYRAVLRFNNGDQEQIEGGISLLR